MAEQITALVVHRRDEAFQGLAKVLGRLGLEVVHARSCEEAVRLFKQSKPVDLIFAGVELPDGGWTDVLILSGQSKTYLPVIVVSQMVDIELYLDALGSGAFDYITPPFVASDLAHIIRSAIYKELVSVKQNLSAQQAV
ncbi:MAG: response regulator [Acidobacteriota bacterium]